MHNIKTIMQTVREGADGWIDEHGVSDKNAEQLFMYIEEALKTKQQEETYEQESINGYHAGEKVRIVKHLTSVGAQGYFETLPEDQQKTGILRNNPGGQTDWDISDFFVDFEDGTYQRVLTAEIEHA